MSLKSLYIWGCIIGLAVSIGAQTILQVGPEASSQVATAQLKPKTPQTIQAIAKAITVKVLLSDGGQGSGILVRRQQTLYTVLTNHHVLSVNQAIQVQTPDRKTYPASVNAQINFHGNDLALIQFRSPQAQYTTANMGMADQLQVGESIFATGFPNEPEESSTDGLKFTKGRVSIFAPKTMHGGYRLGYTNEIVKGMSGGPVLNSQGQVVAVNGMHAYPLWGDPYIFEDGSRPAPSLQTQMVKLSWAIPIETALHLVPKSLKLASD